VNKHYLMAGTVGLFGLTACGWFGEDAAETVLNSTFQTAHAAPQAVTGLQLEPVSYAPLVESLSPAVVNVEVQGTAQPGQQVEDMIPEEFRRFFNLPEVDPDQPPQKTEGAGSGFVISADGYILTNNHVVQGADTITVSFTDEQQYEATLIGADERIDVALLKIEPEGELPYVMLDGADEARVGDRVVAIGNPFGLGHTVTTGIVSGKGRALGAGPYDDFLQTDAAINPGNSGGPLFNLEGEVIGINTAIIAQANNIGFTIPVAMVHDVLEDLKTDGRVARGWLGVGIQTVTPELAEAMGIDQVEGVLLGDIHPGGPADGAGLKSGDIVLTLDGEAVEDTSELIRAVGERRADDTVKLTLLRNGKAKTMKVLLAERPSEQALARGLWNAEEAPEEAPEPTPAATALGFTLEESPDGVLVATVDPDGPAADVLRPGDVVLEVNRQRARSASDAVKRLNEDTDGSHLLVIQREGRRLFVPFKAG